MIEEIIEIVNGLDDRDKMIIDIATKEFAENGFYNTNMDVIAKKSGLGKGTIYRRFKSKNILFFSIIVTGHKAFIKKLEGIDFSKSIGDLFNEYNNIMRDYIIQHYDLIKLMIHEQSKILENISKDKLYPWIEKMNSKMYYFWEKVIIKSIEAKLLKQQFNKDIKLLSILISNMIKSSLHDCFMNEEKIEIETIDKRQNIIKEIIMNGIFKIQGEQV